MTDETWLDRMELEGQELEDKIEKLTTFLDRGSRGHSPQMHALLLRQLGIMHLYASVLQERYALYRQERQQ